MVKLDILLLVARVVEILTKNINGNIKINNMKQKNKKHPISLIGISGRIGSG